MEIVKLTKKDIPQILLLDSVAFGSDYDLLPITEKEVIEILENGFIWGIKDGEKLLSNIQIMKKEGRWHIYGIATSPDSQKKGYADELLKKVLLFAKEEKIYKIFATVRPTNIKSKNLFLKNGFVQTSFAKDYFGKGKDRFIFEWNG